MKFKLIENLEKNVTLYESGISRILQHLEGKTDFAIIGSQDKDTRENRFFELRDLLLKLPYRVGYNHIEGVYTYENDDVGKEDSLIIYNIKKEDALKIAKKINQDTIIWKDADFFGFLTPDGIPDGKFEGEMSFDAEKVKMYGSKIPGKHAKSRPFIFEATLVEVDGKGSMFSKQNKFKTIRNKLFEIRLPQSHCL